MQTECIITDVCISEPMGSHMDSHENTQKKKRKCHINVLCIFLQLIVFNHAKIVISLTQGFYKYNSLALDFI